MTQVERNRTVTRDVIVYNFKGLLEICRYSNQPKANAVMDWLWKIADELRRTGTLALTIQISKLQAENAELKNKMADMYALNILWLTVLAQKCSITFQTAAQLLAQHGMDTGQNRFFRGCRVDKLLCSRKGSQWNRPTQKAIERGLINLEISRMGGFNFVLIITPKGMEYLAKKLSTEQCPLLMFIDAAD